MAQNGKSLSTEIVELIVEKDTLVRERNKLLKKRLPNLDEVKLVDEDIKRIFESVLVKIRTLHENIASLRGVDTELKRLSDYIQSMEEEYLNSYGEKHKEDILNGLNGIKKLSDSIKTKLP